MLLDDSNINGLISLILIEGRTVISKCLPSICLISFEPTNLPRSFNSVCVVYSNSNFGVFLLFPPLENKDESDKEIRREEKKHDEEGTNR